MKLIILVILSLALLISCDSFIFKLFKHNNNNKLNSSNNEVTVRDKIVTNTKKSSTIIGGFFISLLSKKKPVVATVEESNGIPLTSLPYDYTSLEPYISSKTMKYHHDKHYSKYVATTNQLIANTELANSDLITIMKKSHGKNPILFNNAAQSWNHEFYWKCMKPNGGGNQLPLKLQKAIDKSFGSYDEFKKQFTTASNGVFGSGWSWLVKKSNGDLEIIKTSGAENPIIDNKKPLLTCDVWEHAYYLDYQNMRNTYVDTFLDKLVNWDYVNQQLG